MTIIKWRTELSFLFVEMSAIWSRCLSLIVCLLCVDDLVEL